jgi:uncharacterized protein (UPF0332 family)
LLIRKKPDRNIISTLRINSEDSLKVADFLFKENLSPLWVIVTSYYSMYYIANAVLFKLGYKIGSQISHKVTSDALVVFVRDKLAKNLLEDFETAKNEVMDLQNLTDEIIESFDFERKKRSAFQYDMTTVLKRTKAGTSLERAKKFNFELVKLLEKMEL